MLCLACAATCAATSARAETPEQWVELGARIHGGFGSFIALGIRVGLDAVERLAAKPRELDVTFADGPTTPCACIVDGVMVATAASPGQGTLRITTDKAPAGTMAVINVRNKTSGATVRYTIPGSLQPRLAQWNKELDPRGRYEVLMKTPLAELARIDQ
jgi:formylmethanofuran dehydrogenase subunit E